MEEPIAENRNKTREKSMTHILIMGSLVAVLTLRLCVFLQCTQDFLEKVHGWLYMLFTNKCNFSQQVATVGNRGYKFMKAFISQYTVHNILLTGMGNEGINKENLKSINQYKKKLSPIQKNKISKFKLKKSSLFELCMCLVFNCYCHTVYIL